MRKNTAKNRKKKMKRGLLKTSLLDNSTILKVGSFD